MSLSAALIVKDEADNLDACLTSLRGLVDEIVVVDTGSTDGTLGIAERHGAVIGYEPWQGDFATPRNRSLELATGDWILYVDADERVGGDLPGARSLLDAAADCMAFQVRFVPRVGWTPYREYRLWRNRPDIRFRSPIHESVVPAISAAAATAGLRVDPLDMITIQHLGYEGDRADKRWRDEPMLVAELERRPDRAFVYDHLARVYEAAGDGDRAVDVWKRGIAMARTRQLSHPDDRVLFINLIHHLLASGTVDDDLAALVDEARSAFDPIPTLELAVARLAFATGRPRDALPPLEWLVHLDEEAIIDTGASYDERVFGEWAWSLIGLCRFALGDDDVAADAFRRAERYAPGDPSYVVRRRLAEARAGYVGLMSFPWDDPAWCEVGDLLDGLVDSRSGLRILAPDLFWWRVPELWRYVPANVAGDEAFDVVVVHKSEMRFVPHQFLEAVAATMRPVCANAVFVVFSAGADLPPVDRRSDHFVSFVALLAHLPAAPESPHPAVADRVLGTSPMLRRFASLSVADARRAQDEFFTDTGDLYPTRRDQTYHHDLLDHRDRLLAATTGKRVLELCCGAFPAGRLADDAFLVRSDFSPVGVANARDRDHDTDTIVHAVCDASAVALADASCDVVLFVDAIEHVFDAGAVMREAGRVLRPGGELLVTFANRNSLNQLLSRALGYPEFVTNHQHIREFTLAEVEAMLEDADLTAESTAGIELRPYWGVPGVDPLVREVVDDDEELVEALHVLGERVGAEYAYVGVVRARERG